MELEDLIKRTPPQTSKKHYKKSPRFLWGFFYPLGGEKTPTSLDAGVEATPAL